jgi:hypothetical protein
MHTLRSVQRSLRLYATDHRKHNTRFTQTTKAVLGNVAPTSIQDEICLSPPTQQSVLGVILGGGAGTRLYPLTKKRAKPAVPLVGTTRAMTLPL